LNEIITWSPGVSLEEIEKQVILKAFRFYRGNKTATSNALGCSIRTLDNKLEKYKNDGNEQSKRDAELHERRQHFFDRQKGPSRDEEGRAVLPSAATGVRVESDQKATQESPVSVPERKEIQSVLPEQAPVGGSRRTSKAV